ncbi:MAG: class I SAM-dependent methyltransferase [Acetobacteraceae bacterium]
MANLPTGKRAGVEEMSSFSFGNARSVAEDIRAKYGFDDDLLALFAGNKGKLIHKWHHYIPLYDRYFSKFRGRPLRFLEIGVSKGGSLQMWRKYFGPAAILYGIDINPLCKRLEGSDFQVRIGSQNDAAFLNSVVQEMGGVDVVLDDGSHQMAHIRASLMCLFPKLSEGGIYFIEDLHTAYWPSFGGGYRAETNFFNIVRELIDDMHHWYHDQALVHTEIGPFCPGIHIHDSICVLEKSRAHQPVHSQIA